MSYIEYRRNLKLKGASAMVGKEKGKAKATTSEEKPGTKKKDDGKKKGKKGGKDNKLKREKKKALGVFFASQLQQAPDLCEECDAPLRDSMGINPRTVVCHIAPKSETQGCPSVAIHPQNRWFGCEKCHNRYDKASSEEIEKMRIFPQLKERVAKFYHLMPDNERRRVPECLRPPETRCLPTRKK